MTDVFHDASEEFLLKISSLFGFYLCKQEFYWMKEIFFAVVIERLLPFCVCNHLFFYNRGFQAKCNLCVRTVFQNRDVYSLFRRKLFSYKEIFQVGFADVCLPDRTGLSFVGGNLRILICLIIFTVFTRKRLLKIHIFCSRDI